MAKKEIKSEQKMIKQKKQEKKNKQLENTQLKKGKKKKQQSKIQDKTYLNQLQTIMLHFFDQIQHSRCLLFNECTRKSLMLIFPEHNFTVQPDYDQNIQSQKLKSLFIKSKLYLNLKERSSNQQFSQYEKNMKKLFEQILRVSYIMAIQITHELYEIMVTVIDIVGEHYGNDEMREKKLEQFGNLIAINRVEGKSYVFMSFSYMNQEHDLKDLVSRKVKSQQTIKEKYRKKGGPYAKMIKNAGNLFKNIIQGLSFVSLLPITKQIMKPSQ